MAERKFNLLVEVNTRAARASLTQFNRQINTTNRELRNTQKQNAATSKSFGAMGSAISAVVGVLAGGGLIKTLADTTARYEDLETTLSSVTGSSERGAQAFANIKQFATQTQFGVEDLTSTFIKLSSAGITPTQELLTTFTDAAAVTTDQVGSLQAITDLFARTVSGGLGLEEINRLTDRGIPALAILEEKLGLTRNELSEFGKSAEGARKITDALAQGINERFGGATQERLNNLSTSMSNFRISITNALASVGAGDGTVNSFSESLKSLLTTLTGIISGFNGTGVISQALGVTLRGVEAVVRTLSALFSNELAQGITIAGAAWTALNLLFKASPIGRIVTVIVAGFVALGQVIDNTVETASGLVTVGTIVQATFNVISNRIITIGKLILESWNNTMGGFDVSTRDLVNGVIGAFVFMGGAIKNGFTAILQLVTNNINFMLENAARVAGFFDDELQSSINSLTFENPLGELKTIGQLVDESFNTDHIGEFTKAFSAMTGPGGALELVSTSLKNDINAELVRLQAEAAKAGSAINNNINFGGAPTGSTGSTVTTPAAQPQAVGNIVKQMEQELRLAGLTNKQRELELTLISARQAKARELGDENAQLTQQEIEQITRLENKIYDVNQAKQEQIKLDQEITSGFERLGEQAGRWASGTKDAIKGVIAELIRLSALRLFGGTNPLVNGFLTGFGGGNFGGAFADGGIAPANKVSLVGERGPELIIPNSNTQVVPNHRLMSGSTSVVISPTLSINGGVNSVDDLDTMFSDFASSIAQETQNMIQTQLRPRGVFS
jgi:hypothetical protein